jgi:hypothetical protein
MTPPRLACPDCSGVAEGQRLTHDDTCPIGRGIDQVCADDREWFERHPLAEERWRPITPAEIVELRAMGAVAPDVDPTRWRVHITWLADGVRGRRFCEGPRLP